MKIQRLYFYSCAKCGRDLLTDFSEFNKHQFLDGHTVFLLWVDPEPLSYYGRLWLAGALGSLGLLLIILALVLGGLIHVGS